LRLQTLFSPKEKKIFKEKDKKVVDKQKMYCYTNQAKQRRLIASASPPATGKEVNNALFGLP
jgi:hypothetical protein